MVLLLSSFGASIDGAVQTQPRPTSVHSLEVEDDRMVR
jgi:hypothetical protein